MTIKYFDYLASARSGRQPNFIQKCMKGCMYCFVKCVTNCLDYVSKNAFIWTSIYGQSFIPSCFNSSELLVQNLLQVGTVNIIGDSVLWMGKIIVSFISTGILLLAMDHTYVLSSLIMPAVVMFLTCYLVASVWMAIFEAAIDTVLLCFLLDEKQNRSTGYMLASPELIALVDKHAQQNIVRIHPSPVGRDPKQMFRAPSSTSKIFRVPSSNKTASQPTSAPGGYL